MLMHVLRLNKSVMVGFLAVQKQEFCGMTSASDNDPWWSAVVRTFTNM